MSELGLGTMTILKHGEIEAKNILETAIQSGIRHIDTADVYARQAVERVIGETLGQERKQLFLASKGGNELTEDGMRWNPDPSYLEEALHGSLERLQTDYLDLYYIHGGTLEDNLDATIEWAQKQKRDGLIRQIGLSSIRPNVIKYWVASGALDVLMTPYSLLDRRPETLELSIPIVGRGVLAKGLLTDEWETRLGDKGFESWRKEEVASELAMMPNPIQAYALEAAKRFCDVVLPGASSVKQLNETIRAFETEIDEDALDRLLARLPIHPYTKHVT
ncbi:MULTISPECIES: aldo/keto reductase [unclassified Exiguobacterium]|uniref:aldo/keto reductase n=1 Tax=unclassified Exiguobacterium TaxID=2644629 RepID=UPI001BE6CDEC|nr:MULTISPECIES: aldo/keto reductase [unclassified Exiguobacterium]